MLFVKLQGAYSRWYALTQPCSLLELSLIGTSLGGEKSHIRLFVDSVFIRIITQIDAILTVLVKRLVV